MKKIISKNSTDAHPRLANCSATNESNHTIEEALPILLSYDCAGILGFYGGYMPICKDLKWGFVGRDGKILIPFKYDYAHNFGEGLAAVDLDGKRGFIDKDDNLIIPFKYDVTMKEGYRYRSLFIDGFAKVVIDGQEGKIDKEGDEYIEDWW